MFLRAIFWRLLHLLLCDMHRHICTFTVADGPKAWEREKLLSLFSCALRKFNHLKSGFMVGTLHLTSLLISDSGGLVQCQTRLLMDNTLLPWRCQSWGLSTWFCHLTSTQGHPGHPVQSAPPVTDMIWSLSNLATWTPFNFLDKHFVF